MIGKYIKIVLGVFATIILGAIGSGVWEKILSPGLNYLANAITTVLSSLSKTYSDSIYERASDIPLYDGSSGVASIILFFVTLALFLFALNSKKGHIHVALLLRSISRQFTGWWGIVQSGALLIVVLFLMSTEISVLYMQNYSTKQMEILRPYIGEHEYFTLRSSYLRIKEKNDFDEFLKKIKEISISTKVEIKEFKGV